MLKEDLAQREIPRMSTATEIVVAPCTPSNVAALLEASADVVADRGYRPPSVVENESGSARAIGVTAAMVIVLDPEAATLDSDQFDIVMDWYMGCGDSRRWSHTDLVAAAWSAWRRHVDGGGSVTTTTAAVSTLRAAAAAARAGDADGDNRSPATVIAALRAAHHRLQPNGL